MLDTLLGSPAAARVLLYLQNYGDGQATAMATVLRISEGQVRRQLHRFEHCGLLVSRLEGHARTYRWRCEHPLTTDVRRMLQTALAAMPASEYRELFRERARPRRADRSRPQ
jgi:predicted ArsR family transcriptional regulator